MLTQHDIDLPKGSLAKIVDRRQGRIGDRDNMWGYQVLDQEYLKEVQDNLSRFWSTEPGSPGLVGCQPSKIPVGMIVMFVGSVNFYLHNSLQTWRVVLFENGLHFVPDHAVEWHNPSDIDRSNEDGTRD